VEILQKIFFVWRNLAVRCSSKRTIGTKVLAKNFAACYMLTGVREDSVSGEVAARLYAESDGAAYDISESEFAELLTEVLRKAGPVQAEAFLKSLRVRDLALAQGCARGNEKAWDCFLTLYREKLYVAAEAMSRDETTGRELADWLYAELYGTRLREDGRRVSKLESFSGRGSLEGWLKTILAQECVNRFRRQRNFVAFDDALEVPGQPDALDPNLAAKQTELAAATDAALAALAEEERFLLAAYYLDERTLAEVGRMLGAHESTVSRRLEKITARLRKEIIGRLCRGGIAKRAAEEMLELDVRGLGVNVREKLAQERRA
jgi:RNA polymerase sigma-70 factor (ECF subfamily)